ncbi:MAG TPA: TolC family protein [Candidatus Acidoferrales bacterium]|nr:TolC family protein [Candidatus Acidoferrales bacterium]
MKRETNRVTLSEDESSAERVARRCRCGVMFLLAVVVSILAIQAYGQESPVPAAPLNLNLQQAVQMALKQNPSVQIAVLNLAESHKESDIALSQLLPQAEFNVSDRALRENVQANIGIAIPGVPKAVGPFQVFQVGANFSAPVFDLSLWRKWQASRKNVSGADAQTLSVREQIVLLVVSQYLSSLRSSAEISAAQAEVDLAQALYDQAFDQEKHGTATSVDVLRSNVELQNEKQQLIIAQTNQKIALYGLAKLLNLNPAQSIILSDQLTFFETPNMTVDQSLADAYQSRPEMKQLLAKQQALKYEKGSDRDARLPALTFQGDYEQQGISSSTIIPTYAYIAGISFPIFTGGRIRAQVVHDELELKKVDQNLQDERNQIALEVETAAAQLESARNQVQVANLGDELAKEEVQQSQDRFRAGVADNIEVVTAQNALARADENRIAALYQYNQSRADLARAVGRIELLYTK